MKKGFLKVLAAVVAATVLMSMGLSAFAASYTTSTNYVVDNGEVDTTKVLVETEVTGVGETDQVAYLVTENNSGNNNIIWIDQRPATNGIASFEFVTAAANALGNGSVIKVGSTSVAANGFDAAAQTQVKLASYTVTTTTDGNGKVEADAIKTTDYVTFTVYPDAGYAFDKCVIVGADNAETEVAWVTGSNAKKVLVKADTTYKFYFKSVEASDLSIVATAGSATVSKNSENQNVASVSGNALGATEFGILVVNAATTDAENVLKSIQASDLAGWENVTDKNGVRKYQAGGTNEEGDYLISLTDTTGDFFNEASYKAVLYALNGDDLVTSNVFDLAVSAAN